MGVVFVMGWVVWLSQRSRREPASLCKFAVPAPVFVAQGGSYREPVVFDTLAITTSYPP